MASHAGTPLLRMNVVVLPQDGLTARLGTVELGPGREGNAGIFYILGSRTKRGFRAHGMELEWSVSVYVCIYIANFPSNHKKT